MTGQYFCGLLSHSSVVMRVISVKWRPGVLTRKLTTRGLYQPLSLTSHLHWNQRPDDCVAMLLFLRNRFSKISFPDSTVLFRPLPSLSCCCSFALNGLVFAGEDKPVSIRGARELILMFSNLPHLSLTSKQTPVKDSWDWLGCLAATKGVASPLLFEHKRHHVSLCIGNPTQIGLCVTC